MYQITDRQYDFILNDIRARGVELESLQEDLADHICCIIEQQFEEGSNFEQFYTSILSSFYKKELSEIEEETQLLLNNKNYYTMKKIMIVSGILSACILSAGILFKFLHMPGAAFGIVVGITMFSLLFLPLMVVLKLKEKNNFRDRALVSIGTAVAILISMATMFKIMHWPYANMMGMIGVAMLFVLYLPINLVTGIRNPDTKVNTLVSSILLISGCGLFLSLVRSPQGSLEHYRQQTEEFVRFQNIVNAEKENLYSLTGKPQLHEPGASLLKSCEELKAFILTNETGSDKIDMNFTNEQVIGDNYLNTIIRPEGHSIAILNSVKAQLQKYNDGLKASQMKIDPKNFPLFDIKHVKTQMALTSVIQLELMVLQNERK